MFRIGCLHAHNSYKLYESCTWGLWCKTLQVGTYIRTCWLAGHDSKMRDNVTQVLASDAQLLKTLQSYAREALVVHNSQIRFEVMHIRACGAQFRKMEPSYTSVGL